jgi:hypothetical protein
VSGASNTGPVPAARASTTPSSTTGPPTTLLPTTLPTTALVPAPLPAPRYTTADNPLDHGGGLPRLPCALPAWPGNDADLYVLLTVALGCLDHAWQPVLSQLNLPFRPARVVLTDGLPQPDETARDPACARPPENDSYYCDDTVYLNQTSYLGTSTGPRGVPAAAIALLAHEYGHHVQRLAGLLTEAAFRIDQAGADTPDGLRLSRQVEAQAECFAGMFVGATFDQAGIALAEQDADTRGDRPGGRPDHGTPPVFGGWFRTGVHDNSLTGCDPW